VPASMRLLPPAPPSIVLFLLALLCMGRAPLAAEPDKRPFDAQPYLGLSVRDGPGGTLVVGWVLPGPLAPGEVDARPAVRRDDNVVSLDGVGRDAAGFREYLKTKSPGEEVTLVVRRSPEASPEKAIPTGGAGGEEKTFKVVLAKRSAWAGTVGRAAGLRAPTFEPPELGDYEREILARAGELGLRAGDEGVAGGLDALLKRLRAVQDDALDTNSSPLVVSAFRWPLSLDALEASLAQRVRALTRTSSEPVAAAEPGVVKNTEVDPALRAVEELLELRPSGHSFRHQFEHHLRTAWETRTQADRGAALRRLLRTCRDNVSPVGPHAIEHIRLLGDGFAFGARGILTDLVHNQARFAVLELAAWKHDAPEFPVTVPTLGPKDLPPLPPGAVEGEVLWSGVDAFGRPMVVGGAGANRYDMQHLGGVLDVGGDDVYVFQGEGFAPQTLIKDVAGNDLYESSSDFQGPGTTVLGVAWLEDMEGNDIYRSTGQGSIAVGIGGIGVLIDHAGDDLYENRGSGAGWSMGVGFYGAGILIDRAGHDTYRGEKLCQGVGGPLGLGLVLDVTGNDRYDADGPSFPSAYGTPGVHVGMSQGFGYGVRGYAAGGVGALYDLAGDDRYTAGEFSQGGGYYFALGVLHDGAGNDLYHGNRYGQAFAAHQAIGILVDDAGDDTYWSMTAASQSGAWDESITLLLDKQGDDSYRCDGLGQGSAAMQAIALLVDVAGRDRYIGRGGSVQGQGGGNSYHYDADKVFSFNALLDLGGSEDVYSSGRANNSVVRTGKLNEPVRADSDLYGLFLDR